MIPSDSRSFLYMETDIPEGMTISEFRRRVRRPKGLIRRLAGFGVVR